MKFTDGYWLLRKGVKVHYATRAYDVESTDDSLTVYAPGKRMANRGDTLDGPLLTVMCDSPMADVIRVRLTHFAGVRDRPPHFELVAHPAPDVQVQVDESAASLTSGRLAVRISRGDAWRMDFLGDGKPVTSSGAKSLGAVEREDGARFVLTRLQLAPGENVYGLGERFTAFVRNGQAVEIWNEDGGTSSEQAYKNIPFYLTNRGYGVFVNDPGRVSFEAACEHVSSVQFSLPGESLEFFVIYGPTPREVIAKYTALTGRPALPPPWSFGLWLTTSFTTSYDEQTVTGFIDGMAERELPLSVFHFDCFWMREFNWCDFKWDARTFPDPPGMLERLHARGLRVCVWINPYIAQRSSAFAEGAREGYLLKRPNGDVWQIDRWQPGMGLVDFTNPSAREWFAGKLRALLDMGVDCFKTDFGERIPVDAVYSDGSDPERMHNYYTFLYNRTVFDVLREKRGEGQAVLFARSATAGGQRFPAHWGGDSESTFESMAASLRGGLSLGLGGFGFWSHDIGGFEGTPPVEVYKRWIAFGLLSSHSRLHGNNTYRVPWLFDHEAVEVLRHFTNLKCRLMPYLYAAAVEAHEKGLPVLRAMLLEFPDDPGCDFLDRQYLLGGRLLVAPVFSSDGSVSYYLPEGRWTQYFTGQVVTGPRWVRERHDFFSLPLWVRPNSLIPLGAHADRPDYDYADGLTLQLYELEDGAEAYALVPASDGSIRATARARRQGDRIKFEWEGEPGNWQLLLVGLESKVHVDAGTVRKDPRGLLIAPRAGASNLELRLG